MIFLLDGESDCMCLSCRGLYILSFFFLNFQNNKYFFTIFVGMGNGIFFFFFFSKKNLNYFFTSFVGMGNGNG